MKVMVTIHATEANIEEAQELKSKLADLFKEYKLTGDLRGDKYPTGASFTGSYQKTAAKAARPKSEFKYEPKYDPSQYLKGKKEVKKEVKEVKEVKNEVPQPEEKEEA
jgi:hypothetical protein